MSTTTVRPVKQLSRLLTNHWFWILTFVISWIAMITVLIADGYGSANGV